MAADQQHSCPVSEDQSKLFGETVRAQLEALRADLAQANERIVALEAVKNTGLWGE
ncbi:hypothetical protein [Bradyrhizobium sp. LA7.1]|uniref:hypothetical protein n=1 Tax=Bradyrhizobium sp. LA7.1 TaxID=3156324 RepID=UPI0033953A1F